MDPAFLLKKDWIVPSDRKVIKASEYAAIVSAGEILEDAKRRVKEAEAGIAAVVEGERNRGFSEGFEVGRQQAAAELVKIGADAKNTLRRLEADIVRAVVRTVESLMAEVPSQGFFEAALARVGKLLHEQSYLVLRVAPEDYEAATQAVAAVCTNRGLDNLINVEVDTALAPKSCVLESDAGIIDASLQSQLLAVSEALSAQMREGASSIVEFGHSDDVDAASTVA